MYGIDSYKVTNYTTNEHPTKLASGSSTAYNLDHMAHSGSTCTKGRDCISAKKYKSVKYRNYIHLNRASLWGDGLQDKEYIIEGPILTILTETE